MKKLEQIAIKLPERDLSNWLKDKERNPWVLQCISRATTEMNHTYWGETSFDTNIAESAHARTQRDGKHLTLVAAIQRASKLDSQFFETRTATRNMGVGVRYGNRSVGGLAKKSIARAQANENRKQKSKAEKAATQQQAEMMTTLTSAVGQLTEFLQNKLA